jgi:hypothetical protein
MLAHQERSKVEKAVIYSPTLTYDGWNQRFWERVGAYFIGKLYHFKPLHRTTVCGGFSSKVRA